jgi:hypothetical protein
MELSTGKMETRKTWFNLLSITLGDEFTFQQDNNLKHKAKSTLELLTKKTKSIKSNCIGHKHIFSRCYCGYSEMLVPEWPN